MLRTLSLIVIPVVAQMASAQNQAPEISNVVALADTVFHRLRVYYDLSDAENDTLEVIMAASGDGGLSFCLNTDSVTGDIGPHQTPGPGSYFEWDYPDSLSGMVGDMRIRLTANDWQETDIQQVIDGIDSIGLRQYLTFIEGIRHRTTGAAHLQEVRDSILDVFNAYGLESSTHDFPFGNHTGTNLLGRLEGSFDPCRTLIIDGHYDTVEDSPGADDNGSSIAGMLEIVRVLHDLDLGYTVKFIGFDLEEAGLVGSEEYVGYGMPSDEHIAAVINMDMIAYFSNAPNSQTVPELFDIVFPDLYQELVDNEFRANFITSTANEFSDTLGVLFESTAAMYVPELLIGTMVVPGNGELIPDSRRSDHAAFWDAGYMALHLSDGAETRNPNYHDPTDVLDSCNMTFATQITKAVAATVIRLAKPMRGAVVEASVQSDPTSGIRDLSEHAFHVTVMPNPSNGLFLLRSDARIIQVNLFDVTGRLLFSGDENLIDLSAYGSGVYPVSVITDRGKTYLQVIRK